MTPVNEKNECPLGITGKEFGILIQTVNAQTKEVSELKELVLNLYEKQSTRIKAIEDEQGRINVKMAKWGGGLLVLVALWQILAPRIVAAMFGG